MILKYNTECIYIQIIGGIMEQPCRIPESTLNNNIARQLVWRRNAPYFYQTLYTQELEWPSLTVEWWVDEFQCSNKKSSKDDTSLCYVTYGTHTSGQEKNYLIMAKVYVPNQQYLRKMYREKSIKPSEAIKKNDSTMEDKIVVQHQVEHDGQVNKIKHHPKKTNLIATRTPLGQVHIFDKTKFKTGRVKINPSIVLVGHQTEGYSIEWNPNRQGYIVAGSYDGKLTLWDISTRQENNRINPLCYFNFHEKQIEDVTHNHYHDCIFASCDDQGQVVLWDTRNSKKPIHYFSAASSALYSVQFSPLNRNVFVTGGSEKVVKLWDVRNMSEPLTVVKETSDQEIKQLKWSAEQRDQLWVVAGNNMTLWDLNQEKAKYVHAGHMLDINQMDVHPFEPTTIASVDDNNDIQVFQPTRNAFV